MPSDNNRISLNLPEADFQAIRDAVAVLQTKLLPHLVDLNPEDRRELARMGDKTVAFVSKALDYARNKPEFSPAFLDLPEFERDMAAVDLLLSLQRPLSQVMDIMDDSLVLAGSEAYAAALSYYQSAKSAARSRVPGAATVVEDLGQRFPGRAARAAAVEEKAPA